MSKHTPGPWVAGKVPQNPYPDPPGDKWSIQAASAWWIADVYPFAGGCQDDSETQANARLIAAAPDLLAACKTVSEHVGRECRACQETLLAAIAKAEGGKS